MEYFSRTLNYVARQPDFSFHPKCNKLCISHLIFADDIMLMSRGDPISVSMLMDCLKDFVATSGLSANMGKSSVFTAGLQGEDLQDILSITGFQRGSMPFRYLGLPLVAQKLRMSFYAPLIDKISD